MKKTGIVTQINKKYACILTSSGEFTRVRYKSSAPSLGQEYSGDVYSAPNLKLPLIAASLAFIMFSGGLYSYMTPAYAVTLEINPAVRLQVNMWNRIIRAEAINEDGQKLLSGIKVNNMSVDNALESLVSEAKQDNYIDDSYSTENKAIKVTVEGKKEAPAVLKHFSDSLKDKNINVNIISDDNSTNPSKSNSDKNNDKIKVDTPDKSEAEKENKPKEKEKDKNSGNDKKAGSKAEDKLPGKNYSPSKGRPDAGKNSSSISTDISGFSAKTNKKNK